jgi:flagellar biosynthesis protein FlhF
VLPAGVDPGESADLACGFAELGATVMVATRLDLARRLGGVLSAARAGGLCLTEAGTGPGAADGLVKLTPELLAGRLLRSRTAAPPSAVPARRMS